MSPLRLTSKPSSVSPASERLDSWKEVAGYLKRDLRTLQRWEKNEGLPVHRHFHGKSGSVYAYKGEIDAWWNNGRSHLEHQDQRRPGFWRWLSLSAAAIGLVLLVGAVGRRLRRQESHGSSGAAR